MNTSLFRQNIKAILIAMTGWFFFSVGDAITKILSFQYTTVQMIAIAATTGAILSGGMILTRYGPRGFLTPNWKLFAARGVLVVAVSYFAVKALSLISLSDFYGIVFMTPFLVTILSVLFLRERIGIHRITALILGFIGVLVLVGPQMDSAPYGLFMAFAGMVGGSIVTIIIRKIGREKVTLMFAFVPCLANSLVYLPLMLLTGVPPIGTDIYFPAMMLVGITTLIAFICFSLGFTRATETAVIAPFHYTQMVWGVLFGYLLFGDVPPLTTIIGSAIILGAGLYMLWREYVLHKTNHSVSATVSATGTTALPET